MFRGAAGLASRRRHAARHPAARAAADTRPQICRNVCEPGWPEAAARTEPVTALPGLLLSRLPHSPTHSRGRPCSSPWHGKGDYAIASILYD